jgi:hypothetical protein
MIKLLIIFKAQPFEISSSHFPYTLPYLFKITLHNRNPTVQFKIFLYKQPLAQFCSLKGEQNMKTLSIRRTFFLAFGIMVAILVILTTSVFGMTV